MKVYFDYSGRGLKTYQKYYEKIHKLINKLGHDNLSELLSLSGEKQYYEGSRKDRASRYVNSMKMIKKADVIVLELSVHSLSMGYLMHKALESNRPVVALHHKDCDPYFAKGVEDDRLQVIEYDGSTLEKVIPFALDYASDQQDTRFNFFITPKHQQYLDWISKTKKIPRSVYLRDLIERDMNLQENYS